MGWGKEWLKKENEDAQHFFSGWAGDGMGVRMGVEENELEKTKTEVASR